MMHQKSLLSVRVNLTNFASFPKNDFKVPIKRKKKPQPSLKIILIKFIALSSIFFPSFVTVEHQREGLKGLDPRPLPANSLIGPKKFFVK